MHPFFIWSPAVGSGIYSPGKYLLQENNETIWHAGALRKEGLAIYRSWSKAEHALAKQYNYKHYETEAC